ncbi:glycoside hydrolase family 43 protein [Sphingobacterium oryzagri]|uniref:Glycoside hydrolase family 43 protein n=1 Tax=Sphingobacterium oryzagri TaxID=3025669 RepID=A0ABY7WFA6_9SPHI|nr:glycoside hydrolase family 43 protein [Sphingobacterium sp. KACC 22765]WDF68314.1 glycoside hydrolase family 43 protein [Sphingobacterium sp. KACC 22765]
MKYTMIIACMCRLLLTVTLQAQTVKPSNNPLDVPLGDPFILFDAPSETYYLYGTGGTENGFVAYKSTDLKSWEKQGVVYDAKQDKAWGTKDFWAPEVYAYGGKFYLFYSAHWKDNPTNELENYRIGVAVADQPAGPFIDRDGEPLFDPGYPIIDANVYFSDDGKLYLYYSRCCYKHPVKSAIARWAKKQGWYEEIEESWVYGVELAPDFSGIRGKPKLLLRPPTTLEDQQAEWESRSVTNREVNRRWTEGSVLFKHQDSYYMMYSANHFAGEHYAVGYATAKHPLGPFKKSAFNPVLQKNTDKGGIVSGTGHNSVLQLRDGRRLCVYHGRTTATGDQRLVFIDEMTITPAGKLIVNGPTTRTATE